MTSAPSKAYPQVVTKLGEHHAFLFLNTGDEKDAKLPFAAVYSTEKKVFEHRPFLSVSVHAQLGVDNAQLPPSKTQTYACVGKMFGDVLPGLFFQTSFDSIEDAVEQVNYYMGNSETMRLIALSGSVGAGGYQDLTGKVEQVCETANNWPGVVPSEDDDSGDAFVKSVQEIVRMGGFYISPFKPGSTAFNANEFFFADRRKIRLFDHVMNLHAALNRYETSRFLYKASSEAKKTLMAAIRFGSVSDALQNLRGLLHDPQFLGTDTFQPTHAMNVYGASPNGKF